MHNINIFDELWPNLGDYLRYTWPDTYSYFPNDLKLTHNNEYEVRAIRYLPCADAVKIIDDSGFEHWVELYKFSFLDYREEFNKKGNY